MRVPSNYSSIDVLTLFLEMNHSGVVCEQRAAVEVIKHKNGIDQVLLHNSRGASARVS